MLRYGDYNLHDANYIAQFILSKDQQNQAYRVQPEDKVMGI